MSNYQFGQYLYSSSRQMHEGIAEQWLAADGWNDRNDMLKALADYSDEALANEATESWGLTENEEFDRDALVKAFGELRANFDAHFPPSEAE